MSLKKDSSFLSFEVTFPPGVTDNPQVAKASGDIFLKNVPLIST